MPRKPYAVLGYPATSVPDEVRDEAIHVPSSDTKYWLLLCDEDVELLARGVVGEQTSQRAYRMLSWKREQARMTSRALADVE